MNQRDFIASLSKAQRLYFAEKSNRAGLNRLAQQWSLIVVLMILVLHQAKNNGRNCVVVNPVTDDIAKLVCPEPVGLKSA
jgi:hypothetical protein